MKTKHITVLAAIVVVSLGTNAAHAITKRDPIFQSVHVASTTPDPDLARQYRYMDGSPKSKRDVSVAQVGPGVDRDLAREIRYQNGSPKSKSVEVFQLAPLK
jgi:hypothetical protein